MIYGCLGNYERIIYLNSYISFVISVNLLVRSFLKGLGYFERRKWKCRTENMNT